MSHHITKTDTDRWFCVEQQDNTVQVFGQVDLGDVMDSGQPNLQTFLTEDELELYVNSILGPDYYKDAVESGNDIFMGESGKYPMP
tara:strand:+ start:294 stop:551 length:258 start_codon:yes stop_codon:yes gene_type:complete